METILRASRASRVPNERLAALAADQSELNPSAASTRVYETHGFCSGYAAPVTGIYRLGTLNLYVRMLEGSPFPAGVPTEWRFELVSPVGDQDI
jgi:hypothetical protein